MPHLARALHVVNIILFVVLALIGVSRFLAGESPPSRLIVLAVAVVGPLEDYLKGKVRTGAPPEEEPAVAVVDKATSAVFLALLVWVLLLLR